MKQVRINVKTAINASGIKRERRDGRDYIVVPSATMPDNIVMNGVRYPADEIAKAFGSLENTPAPLGHPTVEGAFVSASNPEGLARGWIGAWNRNVRRENGRVFVDKVIDVATASQLEGGKTVLNAIEAGLPIHTSTGLYAMLTAVQNEDGVDWEASEIVFDHDAILVGEDGAATPAQGVGMMVNAASAPGGEGMVDVINSSFEDDADRDLGWAVESAIKAMERQERAPLLERIKEAIKQAVAGASAPELSTNEETFSVNEEKFNALEAKVDALTESMGGLDDKVAAAVGNAVTAGLKPLVDAQEAATAAQTAKDDAAKTELVNKVVAAGLLTEELAAASTVEVLNALADKATAPAFRVNGGFKAKDGEVDYMALAPKGD